jgi:hypothetical protein
MSSDTGLGRKLGNLMTEDDGLGVDKKSHSGLLMLTEWFVTPSRALLTHSPWSLQKITAQCNHPQPKLLPA